MRNCTFRHRRLITLCTALFVAGGCAVGTHNSFERDVPSTDAPIGPAAADAAPSSGAVKAPSPVAPKGGESDSGLDANAAVPPAEDGGAPSTGTPVHDGGDFEAGDVSVSPPTDAGVPDGTDGALDAASVDAGGECSVSGFSGALAVFDLSGQPGSEASATAATFAVGVTVGPLRRASALTPTSGSGSINSNGWTSNVSADAALYYSVRLTPIAGCVINVTSIALDARASSTGPSSCDMATSADGFAAHHARVAATSSGSLSVGVRAAGSLEIRIYAYGASSSAGTFRLQNTLSILGSLE